MQQTYKGVKPSRVTNILEYISSTYYICPHNKFVDVPYISKHKINKIANQMNYNSKDKWKNLYLIIDHEKKINFW